MLCRIIVTAGLFVAIPVAVLGALFGLLYGGAWLQDNITIPPIMNRVGPYFVSGVGALWVLFWSWNLSAGICKKFRTAIRPTEITK